MAVCATAGEVDGLKLGELDRIVEPKRLIKKALQRYGRDSAIREVVDEIETVRLYRVAVNLAPHFWIARVGQPSKQRCGVVIAWYDTSDFVFSSHVFRSVFRQSLSCLSLLHGHLRAWVASGPLSSLHCLRQRVR